MAQDFGDDMGSALLNFVTRQAENYLRFGRGRERAFDWWQRHYKKEGNTPEAAKAMAEKQSSREQVVVPFGTSEEAAYYAQVCRENGTYAAAYTDKQGNGFLAFAKEDVKTVAGYAPQFKDVMARLDEQRITDALNHAEPVNKKTMDSLTELTSYPDLPAEDVTVIPVTIRYKDAPDETYDVLFSEQDTENLNIDDSICFSGYSHKELTEMVGRETHEDFDVIAVGDPYKVHATQVKTDAPEKTYDVPGKDAPARSDKVATLRAEDTAIHTQNIRDAAEKAREACTDFSDFERKMNAQGFGVTETSKEIASHSDIEDEDQTVTMHTSEIGTTATDKLDGDKTVIADAESTVTDKVEYDHVLTGKAYTMAGILMDAKTGLPVLTGEGAKKYTEDDLIKFTSGLMNVLGFQSNTYSIKVKDKDWGNGAAIVKNADGSYTYDASERTENEDGTWTVKTDTQTLTEQEDGTWKLTGLEGSGSATADGGTSSVRNIEETYKADEVEVTDNGIDWSNAKKLPTASIDLAKVKAYAEENKDLLSCLVYKTAEFTPEKESGSIDMDYTFNSNDVIDRLSGETKNLVVFEVMFKGSIENASDEAPVSIVASECDKDNEGQTVKLTPSTIGTTATDKSDGDHELMAGKDAVITDEVKYEGLIPGKEYTLHATLMDKKTGEPLKVADKGVSAELKFTPNSESGTVSINLGEFDATSLDGHTLVVFEELTKQSDIDGKTTDVTVAEHKDINDEGQSVTVTSTPAGSTYGKTGVDMTNIAIAIGILLIAAGCATAYGIKSRKTTKGDADESAEDNTEA